MLSRPGGNPAFNSIEGISNSNFGLRTCFDNKNTKELCLKAITPLYYKMSYLFLIMIAVALLLNGIVLFLYVKGYSKFGKVAFFLYLKPTNLDALLLPDIPIGGL